jgi:hypothetical protein
MFRSLDAPAFTDPAPKAGVAARSEGGAREKASTDSLEQSSIAVRQAAVVELGPGARTTAEGAVRATPSLYSRPPAAFEGNAAKKVATKAAVANATVGQQAAPAAVTEDDARYVRSANGVYYSPSGNVLVATSPMTEATLQKLQQMREAVLSPPTSPEDLQIAARASLDIQRAQLELATNRYATAASSNDPRQSVPPPSTTDVRA